MKKSRKKFKQLLIDQNVPICLECLIEKNDPIKIRKRTLMLGECNICGKINWTLKKKAAND